MIVNIFLSDLSKAYNKRKMSNGVVERTRLDSIKLELK